MRNLFELYKTAGEGLIEKAVDGTGSALEAVQDAHAQLQQSRIANPIITGHKALKHLTDALFQYAHDEKEVVQEKLAFNDSLLEDDETEEFHIEDMADKPEFQVDRWDNLATSLWNLNGWIHPSNHTIRGLSYDVRTNQFFHTEGELNVGIERVNEQLQYATDLSVITDPQHLTAGLAGRSDFVGGTVVKKALQNKALRKGLEAELEAGNFAVVGPRSIKVPDAHNQVLSQYLSNFVSPAMKAAEYKQRNALQEDKAVAKAADIGKDTLVGNAKGALNVAKYVAAPYVAVEFGLTALRGMGVDIPHEVDAFLGQVAICGASFIPSYNEVKEIAGGIDVEKLMTMYTAYQVGMEKGDLSYYHKVKSTFSSEETFQVAGVDGWAAASVNTAIMAATGLLSNPAVFTATMSAQVSANNYIGDVAMCVENHFKPMHRESLRAFVSQNPEAVQYIGVEKIRDPSNEDMRADLEGLNPDIMKYVTAEGTGLEEKLGTEDKTELRAEIREEVAKRVTAYMEGFEQLSENKAGMEIMKQILTNQGKQLIGKVRGTGSETKEEGPTIDKNDPMYGSVKKAQRRMFTKDVFRSIGLPIPAFGYTKARAPEGSFFNRPFPAWNVFVPVALGAMFYAVGQSDLSAADQVNNTTIDSYSAALGVGGALTLHGIITALGAADTAGAAGASMGEIKVEQAREAAQLVNGAHSDVVYNALAGKEGFQQYGFEVLADDVEGSIERTIETYAKSLGNVKKIESITTEDGLTVATYTVKRGLAGKLGLTSEAQIAVVRHAQSPEIMMYTNKEMPNMSHNLVVDGYILEEAVEAPAHL